jgi:hypothetical protein
MVETMIEGSTEPPRTLRKRLLVLVMLLALLVGLAGLFSSVPTTDLVVGCVEEGGILPPIVVCTYLQLVRDPDPNAPPAEPRLVASPRSARPQTIFGFTLAGYAPDNPRAVALVEHFMDKGVDWSRPHDVGLTPLHLAVLGEQEDLVRRFVEAGASPTARADDPGKPYHGDTVLEFMGRLRRADGQGTPPAEELPPTRIEEILNAG